MLTHSTPFPQDQPDGVVSSLPARCCGRVCVRNMTTKNSNLPSLFFSIFLRRQKSHHATPLLRQLHWLPIKARVEYKLACLAFRHFDCTLPQYLSSELHIYQPSRYLRSSSEKLLKIPKFRLVKYGKKSFKYQTPTIWNSLPVEVRSCSSLPSFKSLLKTHLFRKYVL